MKIKTATAVAAAGLLLTACGNSEAAEEPAPVTITVTAEPVDEWETEEGPWITEYADPEPLAAGETYTYADGLEITVSEPYDYTYEDEWTPEQTYTAIDVIAKNSTTDQAIDTTQLWLTLTAGDTGKDVEQLIVDTELNDIDNTLQPGAAITGTYTFERLPKGTQHITATLSWLESDWRETIEYALVP